MIVSAVKLDISTRESVGNDSLLESKVDNRGTASSFFTFRCFHLVPKLLKSCPFQH